MAIEPVELTALHCRNSCEHGCLQFFRPLLFLVLLPAGASLSQAIPTKAGVARKNNRGLYRVNQYRPRVDKRAVSAAQLSAASD